MQLCQIEREKFESLTRFWLSDRKRESNTIKKLQNVRRAIYHHYYLFSFVKLSWIIHAISLNPPIVKSCTILFFERNVSNLGPFCFVSNAITYGFRKWSKLCRWYYSDKLYWGGDLSHVKDNLSSKQQFLFLKNELLRSSHKRKRALLKNPYHKQSTQKLWTFNMNECLRFWPW